MGEVLVSGLIALVGVVALGFWQYGSYQSAMRRRMSQELDLLEKLPPDFRGRARLQVQIEARLDEYLGWSKEPLRTRVLEAISDSVFPLGRRGTRRYPMFSLWLRITSPILLYLIVLWLVRLFGWIF